MKLEDRLKALIATDGPIPVSTWMTLCLHDPAEGYYAAQPGIGRDFTTAPETSQVFGELIGLWATDCWEKLGTPSPCQLAELGPGRATLMADAARAARVQDDFLDAAEMVLIEASPNLRTVQLEKLAQYTPAHFDTIDDIPVGPSIIIANEFLDCLPARQFVRDGEAWHERVIGLDETGAFTFGLASDTQPGERTSWGDQQAEVQPALDAIIAALSTRNAPFYALFIDYGTTDTAPGDTLRAYRNGQQVSVLDTPGRADITVDVDFGRLSRLARDAGLAVAGPVAQGMWLGTLGIEARMQQLVAANRGEATSIFEGVSQLVAPGAMGQRFKAICLYTPGLPAPVGF